MMLARTALAVRLAEWAPVTVVRGVPGCGKTTLVASWLEAQPARELTALWITATEAIADWDSFDRELGRTLHQAGVIEPDRANTSCSGSLGRLHDALLATSATRRVVLVIDDIRHLREESVLASLIGLVQRHRHFHLVVCTRGTHPIESLAAASVEVNTIGAAELLLEPAEISELALLLGKPLDDADVTRLHDAVGGWISVLRLILDAMTVDAMTEDELPLAAAAQYLKRSVLDGLDDLAGRGPAEEVMRFSLAARLDTRLLHDLSEGSDPEALLAALERPGLLDRDYRGGAVILNYPSMIKDVLRDTYTAREPVAARQLHRRLGTWFNTHDGESHAPFALQHAVAGGDWQLVEKLWIRHGTSLAVTHPETLRDALAAVPDELLDRYPAMRIDLAALTVLDRDESTGQSATTRAYIEGSHRVVERQLAALGMPDLLSLGTGHVMGLRAQGRLNDALDFAAVLTARIAREGVDESMLVERLGWFHLQAGLTLLVNRDDEPALRRLQLAWDYGSQGDAGVITSQAAAGVALLYAVRGQLEPARRWLERHDAVSVSAIWGSDFLSRGAYLAAGLIGMDQLDRPAVETAIRSLGPDWVEGELWSFSCYLRAQHALHFGDPARLLVELAEAERLHEREMSNREAAHRLLSRVRADLLVKMGQGQRARAAIASAGGRATILAVPLARMHLLAGEFQNARKVAAHSIFDDATNSRDRGELLLIKAVAAFGMNDRDAAARLMRQALEANVTSPRALATIDKADLHALLQLAGRTLPPDEAAVVEAQFPVYEQKLVLISLTKSERALVTVLERTSSRREIAEALFVSLNTVKSQLLGLYHKLDTTTREDTLMRIRQLGLVP
jgi:LuxR family maltose regulon positive regulatory protein